MEEDESILFVGYLTEKSLTFDRSMRVYFTECLGALDESDMVLDPKEYLLTCEADGSYGGEGKPPSLYYTILDRANMVNPIEPMQYEAPTVQRAVKKDLSDDGQQIGTAWSFLQKYFLESTTDILCEVREGRSASWLFPHCCEDMNWILAIKRTRRSNTGKTC